MSWSPGDTVLVQEVWNGRVWAARPMTVVQDEDHSVTLWFPKGTIWKAPTTPPTRPREQSRGERLATSAALGDWVFVDAAWDVSTLLLMRRVARRAERNEPPFHEPWPEWRPEPSWQVPELPAGWEVRCR